MKIEEELRVTSQALKVISQGVVISRADQLIVSTNAAFSDITQYQIEEIVGKNCRFLQGPLTDKETVQTIHDRLNTGKEFDGEILNYRKDGTTFWNELTIFPVKDEQGEITHFIGITRDITVRKSLKDKLVEQLNQAEKLNKFMQDRELKMVALKKEIEDLKLARKK